MNLQFRIGQLKCYYDTTNTSSEYSDEQLGNMHVAANNGYDEYLAEAENARDEQWIEDAIEEQQLDEWHEKLNEQLLDEYEHQQKQLEAEKAREEELAEAEIARDEQWIEDAIKQYQK
jgi:hypothetical protein